MAAGAAAVIAAVAVVLSASPSPPSPAPLRSISSTAHPPVRVTVPPAASTTTTIPAVLVPIGSNSGQVDYTVGAPVVNLSLSATSSCWVELRSDSASGPLLYQGVLTQGTVKAFQAADLWLRLGYPPGIGVEADGSSLKLPGTAAPLNIMVSGSPA